MIAAIDLRTLSDSSKVNLIPDNVKQYMVEQAELGEYSVVLSPDVDFGVKCFLFSDYPEQHKKMNVIKRHLEEYGYVVNFLYPDSKKDSPIDLIEISW